MPADAEWCAFSYVYIRERYSTRIRNITQPMPAESSKSQPAWAALEKQLKRESNVAWYNARKAQAEYRGLSIASIFASLMSGTLKNGIELDVATELTRCLAEEVAKGLSVEPEFIHSWNAADVKVLCVTALRALQPELDAFDYAAFHGLEASTIEGEAIDSASATLVLNTLQEITATLMSDWGL